MGNAFYETIKIEWGNIEEGRVCFAKAVKKDGSIVEEGHVFVPHNINTEFHKVFGNCGDDEIEIAAREKLKVRLNHRDLIQKTV